MTAPSRELQTLAAGFFRAVAHPIAFACRKCWSNTRA
jgi:hypothetical protein